VDRTVRQASLDSVEAEISQPGSGDSSVQGAPPEAAAGGGGGLMEASVLPFDSIDTIPIEDSRMMLASHDDPPEEQEEPEPEQPAAAVELPVSIDVAGVRGVGDDGGGPAAQWWGGRV
jgi:hypothetical protein